MRHVPISRVKDSEEKAEFDYLVDLYNGDKVDNKFENIMIEKIKEVSSIDIYNDFVNKYNLCNLSSSFKSTCLYLMSSSGRGLGKGTIASMFGISDLVGSRFKEGVERDMAKIRTIFNEKRAKSA